MATIADQGLSKVQRIRDHVNQRIIGLRQDRYSWWTHWRELGDYYIPRRYKWFITPNQSNRGSPINNRIIDSTGTLALRTLASGMMAGITSPAHPWFHLTTDDVELREYPPVKVWLEDVQNLMYAIFAESNFYNGMAVLYQDLACFGTAAMIIYEDFDDVIRCFNPCAGEYYIAVNSKLRVDTIYREFVMTVSQLIQEFGIDNVSASVKGLYNSRGAGLAKEVIVGHAIEPNVVYSGASLGIGKAPYIECYWEVGSANDQILRIRPFYEFPSVCPRWETTSNDAYGRSPAMDALGDVKQLQVEQKRKAQAIDKMVNPPLMADVALKNEPLTSVSGGVTYVPNAGSAAGFKPVYEVKPDLEHMVKDLQEIQTRIRSVFYYDLFMMISQLDTVRSATEIAARKEEKLIMLGPVLERFEGEALDPAIDRTFNIIKRAGLLRGRLTPPPELRNKTIRAEYVSMLSEAQRGVGLTALERYTGWIGSIAAVKPEVLDNVDLDQAAEQYGDMLSVSPKVIVPLKKVMAIRLARLKEMAQDKAMQQSLAAVQGAKVLSETDVGGGQNALSTMFDGAMMRTGR